MCHSLLLVSFRSPLRPSMQVFVFSESRGLSWPYLHPSTMYVCRQLLVSLYCPCALGNISAVQTLVVQAQRLAKLKCGLSRQLVRCKYPPSAHQVGSFIAVPSARSAPTHPGTLTARIVLLLCLQSSFCQQSSFFRERFDGLKMPKTPCKFKFPDDWIKNWHSCWHLPRTLAVPISPPSPCRTLLH